MNLQNSLFLFFIFSISKTDAYWITSCKGCVDILNACVYCNTQSSCISCSNSFGNNGCYKCYNDIFQEEEMNCDNSIRFHQVSCLVRCQVKTNNQMGAMLKGVCHPSNGTCVCATDQMLTFILNNAADNNNNNNNVNNSAFNSYLKISFKLIGLILLLTFIE